MAMIVGLLAMLLAVIVPAPARAAEELVLVHLPDDVPTAQAFLILKEAYRRIGIPVREELMPHDRALRSADSGDVDGDVMRIAGIETLYPNLVRVPESVISFEAVAFTTGLAFKVDGWESLRPYTLCVSRGQKMVEQGTQGMDKIALTSVEQMIESLRRGRCQVAIVSREIWLNVDELKAGPMRALEPPIISVPLYHYVNKRHQALVPRLAETLRQMRRDGSTATITAANDERIEAARRRNEVVAREER